MNKFLYTMCDSKANTWTVPFASDNNATAIREFSSIVKDGRTIVGQHPEDFDLWLIGVFDCAIGALQLKERVHLANGADFVKGA